MFFTDIAGLQSIVLDMRDNYGTGTFLMTIDKTDNMRIYEVKENSVQKFLNFLSDFSYF